MAIANSHTRSSGPSSRTRRSKHSSRKSAEANSRKNSARASLQKGRARTEAALQLTVDTPNPACAIEKSSIRSRDIKEGIEKGQERLTASLGDRDTVDRVRMRASLIYPNDRLGFERVVGERDIVQITFLRQALESARSVCRLRIRSDIPGPPSFGTGFLVAPGVLLTNHHVLEAPEAAQLSLAEFGAELDLNYVEQPSRIFNLLPEKLFVTDPELDFTFVAVNSAAHDGTPLSEFRWLALLRESGKALNGEWVTLIQHPAGETKQIVIRDNRIIFLPEKVRERIGTSYVHYTSDTERGSSGSPVLNDQFEVVALHHKSVPKYNDGGDILARNGDVWTAAMGEDQIDWIANEGVRISEIFVRLDRLRQNNPHAVRLLVLIEDGQPKSVFSSLARRRSPGVAEVEEGPALEATVLARRKGKGYQPNFLGFAVPLPKPGEKLKKFVQPLEHNAQPKGSVMGELVYTHFSVVMHSKRKLAIFAAVNIDGANPLGKPSVAPRWRLDSRIPQSVQAGSDLYLNNSLDKGHLVRRLDPAWGNQQEVDDAVTDTYHYANAAPQEHSFNDGLWGDLEDYLLQMAEAGNHKISVFTGPVFGKDDISYGATRRNGPWLIPSQFWKVIVYQKADGTKSATGFLLDQSDEIGGLLEGFTPLPKARDVARVHQRTVRDIEAMTNLDFGALRTFDPLAELEATKRIRRIRLPGQIAL